MTTLFSPLTLKNFRGDLYGGLTAAVVALPLALAFGITSGLGPIAGLYGAIAAGFFAALFGGTPSQVSGPTGPITLAMAGVVATHATNLPEAFFIVVLGGALQILFGAAKLGRFIKYTPYSVLSGFMTGIGVLIILLQIFPFLGLAAPAGTPGRTISALSRIDPAAVNLEALALAGASLLLVVFWPQRFRKYVPSPLATLILGTLAAFFLLPSVPVIGEVPSGLPGLIVPEIPLATLVPALEAAFVLALLGSIDSLLTSLIADSITRTQHSSDRELIGQGIGNIAAGLLGALPGAGATMRTVVNVRAGGRTALSGMIHAAVLLALALGLGPLAEKIPYAVLAGILVKVGWDIIDWGYLKRLRRVPREKMMVMLTTVTLTVFVGLITAVAIGIILAFFVNAQTTEEEQLKGIRHHGEGEGEALTRSEQEKLKGTRGKIEVAALHGSFSYASARALARRIGQRTSGVLIVIYDLAHTSHIDPSAAMALDDIFSLAREQNQLLMISGLAGPARKTLKAFGVLDKVSPAHRLSTRAKAISAALRELKKREETNPPAIP